MFIPLRERKKGFTFVETLVALGVFALLMVALTSSVLFFYRSNSYVMEQSYAISEGRKGIENMVENIREAIYSETGDYPVKKIGHHQIVFYADVDWDSDAEKVKYFIDDKKLKKSVTEASGDPLSYSSSASSTSVISDSVRNAENEVKTFVYYDKNGDKMTEAEFDNIADVAFVRVSLVVNIDPTDKPRKFTLRSSASLRNVD